MIPLDGAEDEVAVWTRALTNTEIGTLWNGGQGLAITTAVPEPAGLALLGLGLVAARARRRR